MKTRKLYVTMTDKFMSGWGKAEGLINKLIVECDTREQAEAIKRNAQRRGEMKYINICLNKPSYNSNKYYCSWKKFGDMGEVWTR